MELTFEQITDALQQNEELSNKVKLSFLTPDNINGYLETTAGK